MSIGLPVYNGGRFVDQAARSVLRQDYQDLELIICDNASTDDTAAVCEALTKEDRRVRYVRHDRNLGAARNFNSAFTLASGEYFKWIAADDVLEPEFLSRCVATLDAEPRAVLAYTRATTIDEEGRPLKRGTLEYDRLTLLGSSNVPVRFRQFLVDAVPHCALTFIFGLIRSQALRRTRLIAPYAGSDVCLLVDLILAGAFAEVPEYLVRFRRHRGSFTSRLMETLRTGGLEGETEAAWFDPTNKGRIVLPNWRFFGEHLWSVVRSRAGLRDKVAMVEFLARLANWRRQRLGREIGAAARAMCLAVLGRRRT